MHATGTTLLFTDEYHLTAQDITKRGWVPKGLTIQYLSTNETRKWYSMIVTCTFEKIIVVDILQGTIGSR